IKPRKLAPGQWTVRRSLVLPPSSNFVYHRRLKDPANVNHCIQYSLYLGNSADRDLRAKILLLAQMTNEPAFNQLRTIEQLGYIVFSGASFSDSWAGYSILVQSEKDCQYLEGRIEHFLNTFEKTLDEMSEEDFEGHKRAVSNKRIEKLHNLTQESNRFWKHTSSDAYDFFQADEDARHVEALTKVDLQVMYADYFLPSSPHRAKISVHLIAQAK
ncbi:hypothetical protein AOQ84DRAFT_257711, partial [Glonium stellatum]